MQFYEELPPNCPPGEAAFTKGFYYRLGSIPPDDSDFWSHRQRFPHKVFHVSECVARSLSVFDERDAVEKVKRLVPALRSKPVFEVDLTENDGMVQQTGSDLHHHSWWRSIEFDLSTIKIID